MSDRITVVRATAYFVFESEPNLSQAKPGSKATTEPCCSRYWGCTLELNHCISHWRSSSTISSSTIATGKLHTVPNIFGSVCACYSVQSVVCSTPCSPREVVCVRLSLACKFDRHRLSVRFSSHQMTSLLQYWCHSYRDTHQHREHYSLRILIYPAWQLRTSNM